MQVNESIKVFSEKLHEGMGNHKFWRQFACKDPMQWDKPNEPHES
jgi:hypothetical protein